MVRGFDNHDLHANVALQIARIVCNFFQQSRSYPTEKAHRIVFDVFTYISINCAIESMSFGMPALPQIVGEFIEPTDTRRHYSEDRQTAMYFH